MRHGVHGPHRPELDVGSGLWGPLNLIPWLREWYTEKREIEALRRVHQERNRLTALEAQDGLSLGEYRRRAYLSYIIAEHLLRTDPDERWVARYLDCVRADQVKIAELESGPQLTLQAASRESPERQKALPPPRPPISPPSPIPSPREGRVDPPMPRLVRPTRFDSPDPGPPSGVHQVRPSGLDALPSLDQICASAGGYEDGEIQERDGGPEEHSSHGGTEARYATGALSPDLEEVPLTEEGPKTQEDVLVRDKALRAQEDRTDFWAGVRAGSSSPERPSVPALEPLQEGPFQLVHRGT